MMFQLLAKNKHKIRLVSDMDDRTGPNYCSGPNRYDGRRFRADIIWSDINLIGPWSDVSCSGPWFVILVSENGPITD